MRPTPPSPSKNGSLPSQSNGNGDTNPPSNIASTEELADDGNADDDSPDDDDSYDGDRPPVPNPDAFARSTVIHAPWLDSDEEDQGRAPSPTNAEHVERIRKSPSPPPSSWDSLRSLFGENVEAEEDAAAEGGGRSGEQGGIGKEEQEQDEEEEEEEDDDDGSPYRAPGETPSSSAESAGGLRPSDYGRQSHDSNSGIHVLDAPLASSGPQNEVGDKVDEDYDADSREIDYPPTQESQRSDEWDASQRSRRSDD